MRRLRVEIRGAVQGVGFRPFVHRLARELGCRGWVVNDPDGVRIEVEAPGHVLERFLERLEAERPSPARVESNTVTPLEPNGESGFEIRPSRVAGRPTVQMLPDIATCDACRAELLDPGDRRHDYPFTNCTHCGPRFSILRSLPYDRPRTSMAGFEMCPACRREYDDPSDRRFHAQPNACPACGPGLALWDREGNVLATGAAALDAACAVLRAGRIVAAKGLGGFHLLADARDGGAIGRLREGKPRREKPFAVMAADIEQALALCSAGPPERELLASPEAPIVLLRRRPDAQVAAAVAPENPYLGVMLPYTPLHHLLLGRYGAPVVATSGNLSDEPICIDEHDARERLGALADRFLVHDRPIVRHVDDSVVAVIDGSPRMLRRARGYAPRAVPLGQAVPTVLAVGAHLKNAIALSLRRRAFVSQHIGDMETPQALSAFEGVIADFLSLYDARPRALVHDRHPDYPSTRFAQDAAAGRGAVAGLAGLPTLAVQHHHAHLAACLADNGSPAPALGVTWDGTGFGPDGTVWGGEFLLGDAGGYRRVAHLRPFSLPGGEAAVREPRRTALALLWELEGEAAFEREDLEAVREFAPRERALLARMLERGIRAPRTTSAGRLFDAVAALLGIRQRTTFEAQAAMELEFRAEGADGTGYPFELQQARDETGERLVLDWGPAIDALGIDRARGRPIAEIAASFHETLVDMIAAVAAEVGEGRVALTGGCFQNRRLVERAAARLRERGFEVLLHRRVPPGDGGICLGQVAVAAALIGRGEEVDTAGGAPTIVTDEA
jgi:hydrogenase maturation protein HypF